MNSAEVHVDLLLVEDDPLIGDGIRAGLSRTEFDVQWVTGSEAAGTILARRAFDVVVLDVGLPGCSGLELLARLRERGSHTPVLVLTAYGTLGDKLKGFEAGADDYLVKPFEFDELLARLRALARRGAPGHRSLRVGDIEIDRDAIQVRRSGVPVPLHRREFDVLCVLAENAGRVLSRTRIEAALYAPGEPLESNAVEVHVHHLRRKLGSDLIRTVRGVGYVIDARP
ncbi:MAG: response regulator transcription factor [Gammaproteobacteria bacterium]